MSDTLWAIRCVWLRYFAVYRKNLFYALLTTFAEPLLYVLSFGFGMGSLIGEIRTGGQTVTYRAFILSGLVAQTLLVQGFFDAAYGGFVRMYYQRIFKAMATTPITLSEVLWGELLWDASKATFSAGALLLIGVAIGDFSPAGALAALPLCFFGGLCFAALGLWSAAVSPTIESLSYPQYLLIFPMFLFCGIYFPLENLPGPAQAIAWVLPVTSAASLARTLLLGFPLRPEALWLLSGWLLVLVALCRRRMTRRLIK